MDINSVNVDGKGGLLERLLKRKEPHPRKRRGIRHSQASILAIAICAVLSQARNFAANAQWASYLRQELHKRLGVGYNSV